MADEPVDVPRLTRVYRRIRDAKAEAYAEYKKKDRELTEQLAQVEHLLLEALKTQNVEGLKSDAGYVQRYVKRRFWTSDWASFKDFVKEHDALDLFEQRLSQRNMEQWVKENPDAIPAGLNIDSRYRIKVTKPKGEM